MRAFCGCACGVVAILCCTARLPGGEKDSRAIELAKGRLTVTAPESWIKEDPETPHIEYEFAVPSVGGNAAEGRFTVRKGKDSIFPTIDGWYKQFRQSDARRAKIEPANISGATVHFVDISGTFHEQPILPPRARRPGGFQANYRMLSALIATKETGIWIFEFYGPEQTIADHEANFRKMIKDLRLQ